MKRQFFTLVELLLVIAIIAILAGIAIPVVGGMNKKGKETKARSEINAIKLAFQQFETDYGAFPQIKNEKNDVNSDMIKICIPYNKAELKDKSDMKIITQLNAGDKGDGNRKEKANLVYDEMMQILNMTVARDDRVKDKEMGDAYTTVDNPNGKRKRYLDPPVKKVRDNLGKEGLFFLDPWGRRYNIALDYNYDNKVENSKTDDAIGTFGGETENLMGKIFIFSYGDGNTDNPKNYITSWKTSK